MFEIRTVTFDEVVYKNVQEVLKKDKATGKDGNKVPVMYGMIGINRVTITESDRLIKDVVEDEVVHLGLLLGIKTKGNGDKKG